MRSDRGDEGDRYNLALEIGFYSHKREDGRQITLFEIETLWALRRDHDIELGAEEHRRNVTVEGTPLPHLVGRRFWLGETLLEGTRLRGTPTLRSANAVCTSMAQRTASTTLRNSAMKPSRFC